MNYCITEPLFGVTFVDWSHTEGDSRGADGWIPIFIGEATKEFEGLPIHRDLKKKNFIIN